MVRVWLSILLALLTGPAWAGSIPFQTDKTTFTEGSGGVQVLGACVNDTRGGNIAEDNVGCLRATNQGDLHDSPYDSGGTAMSDTTAHALKVLSVDTTGAAVVPSTIVTDASTITRGQTNVLLSDVALFADNGTNYARLQADGSGFLKTSIQNSTLAVTQSGAWSLSANQSVNVAQINGITPLMGNGVTGTGSPRVTIASDNTAFTVNAAQSGTWTVQPGNTANTTAWLVSNVPATSGGTTPCYITSAASTNATNCKASAGQLYGVEAVNTTATIYYLRLYNLASAPTCSSATGFVRTIPVPPYAAAGGAGGIVASKPLGEAYGTGLGFCLTGGGSSTDNTNAATGVYLTLNYK